MVEYFADKDAIFIMSYSIIMLNVDLHNKQVKTPMTLKVCFYHPNDLRCDTSNEL